MRATLVCLVAVVALVASALGQSTCPTIEVTQHQAVQPPDGENKGRLFFGKYFRISNNWMLVGAYGTRGHRGAAHFFELIDEQWTFVQSVSNADAVGGDYFGLYLALSGDVGAVSAPYHPTFGQNKIGRVTVYERSGSTWPLLQTLEPDQDVVTVNNGYTFGYGLGSQGNTIVVGARGANSPSLSRAGAAFVYSRSGMGEMFELDQVLFGTTSGTQFGDDILVGGLLPDTGKPKIVVTAPRNPPSAFGAGYVFLQDADTGVWSLDQVLQPDDSSLSLATTYAPHHWEGAACYKDTLIGGGERGASDAGRKTGAAWVWDLNETDQWVQGDGLFPERTGRFGQRLDVRGLADGSMVAFVGSWLENVAGVNKAGAAYYYVPCDDNTWSRGPRIVLDTPGVDDQFGNMVAMSDGWVAIGAPKRDSGSKPEEVTNRGEVYMYKFSLGDDSSEEP